MKTLFLIRHAKSSWDDTALPDNPKNRGAKRCLGHCDKGMCNGRTTSNSNMRENCTREADTPHPLRLAERIPVFPPSFAQ
jgi:hypothetical protein